MYPIRRRIFLVIFAVISMLFSCTGDARGAEPQYGRILTFGAENEFRGFDALSVNMLTICDSIVNSTVQERLFDVDGEGKLVPVLGLSATSSPDGKDWTITLRPGVSFHDGTPFNADAVVHHWSRLLKPENKFRGRSQVAPIRAVEKADDYTVRFALAHAWLPFPKILADTRTLAAYIPSPQAVESRAQMRAPVGTGPYMFKEWKTGNRLVVVKNPTTGKKGNRISTRSFSNRRLTIKPGLPACSPARWI
jgi:ABC-type transport system substrate-binding protein